MDRLGTADTAAPSGELLDGRWHLGEVLGRGAAADVLAAVDTESGAPVAVKVIRATEEEQVRRFERELAALEGVDHPGIVAVLGHGELADGRPFVVLERASGGTLADALEAGPLGSWAAARLGAGLAAALHHAHERGVVHRDVKPANVLLVADGEPKLADFGVARVVGSSTLTASGLTMGTPAYLAPEQVRGESAGPSADVYALGLVVLEAATGARAYPGDGVAAALARLERPVDVPQAVPPALANAIRAMTADDPAERPTAAAAATRLEAAAGAGDTAAIPIAGIVTTATPAVRPPRAAPVAPVAPVATSARRGAAAPPARRALVAALCFVAGFLAVALVHAASSGNGPRPSELVPDVTTTSATVAVTSTTAPPPPAPPPGRSDEDDDERDDDEGEGNGRGNGRGNGGEGRDRSDD